MIRRQKHGWLVAVLAGAALAACVQGEQQSQSADSTARNLTLAPTESTAALKDVPPPATEAAKPAPEKKAPVKNPVGANPAPRMLAAGTRVPATANDTISTRSAKAGDSFTATVSQDVKDATGRVVRSEEHTSELQSRLHLVCRLLLEKKKKKTTREYLRTS